MKNIIIGKSSNLSKKLYQKLENVELFSARELLTNINLLDKFKDKEINVIFNNFQVSTKLNDLSSPKSYINLAITSTAYILEKLIEKSFNINKIIYTSSSSVYGSHVMCKEDDALHPSSLHASLKISNEEMIKLFCKDNKIDYTITRVFNMYGGDDHFSVISKIIKAHNNNDEFTTINMGESVRDYIHIDDVVEIYLELLDKKNLSVINIGRGFGYSIKEILCFLEQKGFKIKQKNIFVNELSKSVSNNTKLLSIIDYEHFHDLKDYLISRIKVL